MNSHREEKYHPCEGRKCDREIQLGEAALVRTSGRTLTVLCSDCIELYYADGELDAAGQESLDPTMKNYPIKEYTVTFHTRVMEHRSHTVTVRARSDSSAANKADHAPLIDEGTVVHRQQVGDPKRSIRSIKEVSA